MLTVLSTALGFGLAAGVSPGPLLLLVVISTLREGLRHGVAVAAAPLLSDLLIVSAVLAGLGRLPIQWVNWLGLVGGVAVIAVGVHTVATSGGVHLDGTTEADGMPRVPARRAFSRGVLVNLVSPHPWIAWITAFGPLTVSAWRAHPAQGVVFVAGFYVALVGSKVLVALMVAGERSRQQQKRRRRTADAGSDTPGTTTTETTAAQPTYQRLVALAGIALAALGAFMLVEFGRSL